MNVADDAFYRDDFPLKWTHVLVGRSAHFSHFEDSALVWDGLRPRAVGPVPRAIVKCGPSARLSVRNLVADRTGQTGQTTSALANIFHQGPHHRCEFWSLMEFMIRNGKENAATLKFGPRQAIAMNHCGACEETNFTHTLPKPTTQLLQ